MNNLDEYFLKETFTLAKKAEGIVSPNPLVGACMVKNGIVIGRGYHKGPGTPHAEVEAIKEAGNQTKDATLYVSLEPCCHHGKTPPCAELIESSGISRVVAPIKDPNTLVDGKGFKYLKSKGIKVDTGILEEEAKELNVFYLKYITKKIPYVILKAAITIDGRIGDPKRSIFKISGKESDQEVHRLRNKVDAVLIGIGTVLTDNPALTVREVKARKQPYKIIIDPNLKCPADAKIFKGKGKVILVTAKKAEKEKYSDAEIWNLKEKNGLIDIKDILKKAGEKNITSIMLEGGSKTFTHFVKSRTIDKYLLFFSPSFIGKGIPFIDYPLNRLYLDAIVKSVGNDFLIEAAHVHGIN
jgi:diaminohydroxyphosphoribosylaminopyrimidine deaminase/5-amino-6-(5-phosphoribosylamino)uracil reductase